MVTHMLHALPAGLKASAGVTKPSAQRAPGGLERCSINLTITKKVKIRGRYILSPTGCQQRQIIAHRIVRRQLAGQYRVVVTRHPAR